MRGATVWIACALLILTATLVRADAQPRDAASPQPSSTARAPAASDDAWGFDEQDEPVETWTEVLRGQAVDLVLISAFFALALVGFLRKSVLIKRITLVFAVVYMGFAKSELISIVNIFGVMDWNLPIVRYNLEWYVLAIFTVGSTVLWGRVYCGRICAYGAFTQLMDDVIPARWRWRVPRALERRASWIKFGLLGGVIVYYLATKDMSVHRYVEPFWAFGLFGTTPMWIGLGLLVVATVFVRNLYCRFLCPVGAALGILSNLTVFRIKRWSECSTCKICQKTCEWGAIDGPTILKTECVRCDDCERVYADQKKCPHWRILDYRARKQQAAFIPIASLKP